MKVEGTGTFVFDCGMVERQCGLTAVDLLFMAPSFILFKMGVVGVRGNKVELLVIEDKDNRDLFSKDDGVGKEFGVIVFVSVVAERS